MDKEKILFLHPTKTAGTSIEHALSKSFGYLGEYINHEAGRHYTYKDYSKEYDLTDFIKIISVRHPYDRVISEFKYQLCGGSNCLRKHSIAHRDKNINLAILDGSIWECGWPHHDVPQSEYWSPDCFILKFESLNHDWHQLKITHDLPLTKLPHLNKSSNQEFQLTKNSKSILLKKFHQDFLMFDYKP